MKHRVSMVVSFDYDRCPSPEDKELMERNLRDWAGGTVDVTVKTVIRRKNKKQPSDKVVVVLTREELEDLKERRFAAEFKYHLPNS